MCSRQVVTNDDPNDEKTAEHPLNRQPLFLVLDVYLLRAVAYDQYTHPTSLADIVICILHVRTYPRLDTNSSLATAAA